MQQQQQQPQSQTNSNHHHLLTVDGNGTMMSTGHLSSRNSSQNNSFSYRHHIKCCTNLDQQLNCGHHNIGTGTMQTDNIYGTTPRIRQINTKLTMASQTQTSNSLTGCSSNNSSTRSSIRNSQNDHNAHTIDYGCGNASYINCK